MSKVLIVEDDPVVVRVYRGLLERHGFQVEVASNGEQALELVQSARPSAVILDLMLPKLSGIEVLKRIRSSDESTDTPVYVLTNAYVDSFIKEAENAGATLVFNKGTVTARQLVDRLLAASPSHRA